MQKIKILIIVILLISLCCSTSYCFSDFYTWSVNSVQTSTSISENSNGNFLNLEAECLSGCSSVTVSIVTGLPAI